MNTEALVLRALLRLSRRRLPADDDAIVLRVGAPPAAIRVATRRLDAMGLVERRTGSTRLTMAGLAVAVAGLPVRTPSARRTGAGAARAA